MKKQIRVQGHDIAIMSEKEDDYISLTDMLKAKDGDFFISDWLRNRNTLEFLGIWEKLYNDTFNYGEFAIIKSKAGLNSFKNGVANDLESYADRDYIAARTLFQKIENCITIKGGSVVAEPQRHTLLGQW